MPAELLILILEFLGVYIVFKVVVRGVREIFDELFGGFRKSKHSYDDDLLDDDLFDDDLFDDL